MGQLLKHEFVDFFRHHLHFLQSYSCVCFEWNAYFTVVYNILSFPLTGYFSTTISVSLLLPHILLCDYLIWMAIFLSLPLNSWIGKQSHFWQNQMFEHSESTFRRAVSRHAIEVNKTLVSHLIFFYSLFELGNRFIAHFILSANANTVCKTRETMLFFILYILVLEHTESKFLFCFSTKILRFHSLLMPLKWKWK